MIREEVEERAAVDAYVPQFVIEWLEAGGDAPEPQARTVEGTLVFADISGFTPLSERLARKGRIGSEELTDILNRIFGELLDVASGYGGDLLKYGGDALLLFFHGADDAARASVAAATMQRVLREGSRIDTGSGIVRLRMSVGAHRGTFLFTLVGDAHRELVLTGPGATTTVRMEAAASADEVLVSASMAEGLDPSWLGNEKDGGRLLRLSRVDRALPAQPFARRRSPQAARAVPEALRDHLGRGAIEGEHRHATLAFVQFKGTDELYDRLGPEGVAREVHRVIVECQRAAERHGVTFLATDVDADGGKVLFATGVPSAGVNDSDRMLLAMRDVARSSSTLSVRAGVNRGPVFAVDIGAPYRRTYAVMGDATNLAARVMGKAAPRGVLATDTVAGDLRAAFDLAGREPFLVKGKSHPIIAFDVGEPLRAHRDDEALVVPVIGHDRESEALERAVEEAGEGRGSVVALVGGPGLGKTRLVTHLLDATADHSTILFEGGQYAAHTPQFALRPALRSLVGATVADEPETVVERLRQLVGQRAPHLEPWLPLLDQALGVELDETPETRTIETRFRRSRLAALIVDLLDHVLPKPTFIVIEDAHWLDDSSAAILREVVSAAPERAWVACVTSRDATAMGLDTTVGVGLHRLEPLEPDESRELLYHLMGDSPLPPLVVAAIAERGAGNPLFLSQLLDAARAGEGIEALPDSLEGMVASRVDALAPADRSLLRSASVLGARFPGAALAAILSTEEDLLREGLRRLDAFVVADGETAFRFKSALLRQVAYETLAFSRRRELHARAADVLEEAAAAGGERPVALLSLHHFEAGHFAPAWGYAREAGQVAASSHAAVEAAALYRRALEAARHLPDVEPADLAAVCLALGEQREYAGDNEGALSAFARARALAKHHPVVLATVMLKDGWLRERSKYYADALRWYTRALRVLEAIPPPDDPELGRGVIRIRAEVLLSYGAVRLRQGRFKDALTWLHRAAGDAAAADADDVLAHAYYLLDWALTDLGRAEEAVRYRELALPIYERLGDWSGQANVLNNLGIDAYYEGRWDEAISLYERSRQARERSGDIVQLGLAANNIGEILSDQGHSAEAQVLFRDALRLWRGSNFRIGEGVVTSNLGRVASRAGDLDEARARYAEAAAIFDGIGAASFRLDVDVREAERWLFAGVPTHALVLAREVCARFDRAGTATPSVVSMAHRIAACALALLGRVEESLVELDQATQVAEQASATYEHALALEARSCVLSILGDPSAEAFAIAGGSLLSSLGVESTMPARIGPLARTRDGDVTVDLRERPAVV